MRFFLKKIAQTFALAFLVIFLSALTVSVLARSHFPLPLPAPPEIFGLKKKLELRLTASQISYSNWAAGGDAALSYAAYINTSLVNNTKLYNVTLQGKFAFGQTKIGGEHVRNSLDRIEVESSTTIKKKKYLNPFASMQLLTQFTRGYDYSKNPPVARSGFWDPAYITQSAGSGIRFNENVYIRMGLALKETFTKLYPAYSDDPRTKDKVEHFKLEKGINSQTQFKFIPNKNLRFLSKIQLFYNMKRIKDIDVRWESQVTSKLAKYFSVNINVYMIYDNDVTSKAQIKQTLSMGFTYNFF